MVFAPTRFPQLYYSTASIGWLFGDQPGNELESHINKQTTQLLGKILPITCQFLKKTLLSNLLLRESKKKCFQTTFAIFRKAAEFQTIEIALEGIYNQYSRVSYNFTMTMVFSLP